MKVALHEVRQARILSTERELREFDEFVEEAASGSGLAGCGPSERGGAQSAKCEAQSGELVWHELDDGAERCAGCGPSERGMGNIHQTVDWGLWQAKSKMRDKCWVVGVYGCLNIVLAKFRFIENHGESTPNPKRRLSCVCGKAGRCWRGPSSPGDTLCETRDDTVAQLSP